MRSDEKYMKSQTPLGVLLQFFNCNHTADIFHHHHHFQRNGNILLIGTPCIHYTDVANTV